MGGKLRLASCSLQSAKPELLNGVIERQTSKFKDTITVVKRPQEIINVLSLEFSGKDCKPSSQECCERAFKTRTGVRKELQIILGASLVVQWLRIRLPMQGTQVRSLVREDPTYRRATKPVRHNY
ncbi:hypothetical protein J1605_008643 [Eschrichtius robustus]|uniref:Uncharacterized protein n=1 Tax=Eschrichtius robustus TaxID=9764 RepID=A0AB34GYP5_ESCRO|nr:hypothetical protein J1605_008643 [Eschrichtius robustus]